MRRVLAIILCVWLTGCVNTQVSSQRFVNTSADQGAYRSVFVWVAGASLQYSRYVEETISSELKSEGVTVYPGTAYAPFDAKARQIADSVVASGADGFLLIIASRSGYDKSYVPPSYTPGQTTTNVQDLGDRIQVTTSTTPGYVTPGYNLYFPYASFVAHLYDARIGTGNKEVWLAQIASNGSAVNDLEQVFKDVGKETAKKLKADGVLGTAKK